MPVNQLIMIMYNTPSALVYEHFKQVNAHIKSGIVQPGQVVLLSPPNAEQCTQEEQAFLQVARQVDLTLAQLDVSEKEVLAKRYDFLTSVASYNGLILGVSNSSWNAHAAQVKAILKQIESTYVTSYNSHGNLSNNSFFQQRKMHFSKLNAALLRFGQPEIGGRILPGNIRNNLGISSRSTVRQWNKLDGSAQTIPNFAKNYETVAKMSRNLKRVGYVGIFLTGIDATMNIRKACLTDSNGSCTKTKYSDTGKAAGSVVGGIGAGFTATYLTCNLLFGFESFGTSAFWCSLVAGSVGGYWGGAEGGSWGKKKGEELYHANSQNQHSNPNGILSR